jgi:hypothetical protein
MMTLPHFYLSITPPDASMIARLSTPPAKLCLDLGLTQSNAPAALERSPCAKHPSDDPLETAETLATLIRRGSCNYDWEHGIFTLEWANFTAFDVWCWEEELCYSIELVASTVKPRGPLWTQYRLYICSRQLPGSQNSTKKRIRPGITRSTRKKPAAIAGLQSNFICTQISLWAII